MCSIVSLQSDRTRIWSVLWLEMLLAEGLLPLTWHMGWGNAGLAQGSLPWCGWKASPSLHSTMICTGNAAYYIYLFWLQQALLVASWCKEMASPSALVLVLLLGCWLVGWEGFMT